MRNAVPRNLHNGVDSGDAHAQDERHPGHAFVADHADFERSSLVDRREQRNQAVDGKVDVTDRLPRLQNLREMRTIVCSVRTSSDHRSRL